MNAGIFNCFKFIGFLYPYATRAMMNELKKKRFRFSRFKIRFVSCFRTDNDSGVLVRRFTLARITVVFSKIDGRIIRGDKSFTIIL